ncbi:MAG TPA: DUF5398 family protein [Rhabdochlamydiaceae bacterium]|nr:DUF5398 family protein [Rhabdochlamydiaceae bacterium]
MYGFEKKGRGPVQFDLEVDLRSDPEKAKKLLKEVEGKIFELKNLLRQGAETDDFDDYGVLLHAYAALQRVLNRILAKK